MASTQVGVLRKGAWNKEEDNLLRKCIEKYGEGKWHQVPHRAGLNRCRKSCRLRWLNYLSPNIRRGNFTPEEDDLIIRLHKLLGNRWSLITGRLPGRTANEVKNHWNSHLRRKVLAREEVMGKAPETTTWKPRPRTFKRNAPFFSGEKPTSKPKISTIDENPDELSPKGVDDGCRQFWSNLLNSTEINGENEAAGSIGISLGLHEEDNGLIDFSLDMDIWELLSS